MHHVPTGPAMWESETGGRRVQEADLVSKSETSSQITKRGWKDGSTKSNKEGKEAGRQGEERQ